MKATIQPFGWPMLLNEVRPGLILVVNGNTPNQHFMGFKSEYRHDNSFRPMAFNESGEFLCVDDDRLVQAVDIVWEPGE